MKNLFFSAFFSLLFATVLQAQTAKRLINIKAGGAWMGIHGAGDNSHHWDWYEKKLVGAHFSHHLIEKHLQKAQVTLNSVLSGALIQNLPATWIHTDEWYVFTDNPRTNGFNVVYSIDGEKINPNGNFLLQSGKNFGMGKDHPVAWYGAVGKGQTFYISMAHDSMAWRQPAFVQMLQNAINSFEKR